MRVVGLIEPLEGKRYVEPVRGECHEENLDTIYNISSMVVDYINPTTNGKLSWKSVSSCSSNSREALEK